MNNLAFELPLNSLSFGQISVLILRTLFEQEKLNGKKYEISLFPIGQIDLSSQVQNPEFNEWIKSKIQYALENHSRETPIFKLWHLNGSINSFSERQTLLTFHELDSATPLEINAAKNNNVLFSSKYSQEIFGNLGIKTGYLPLAFDSFNFKVINKKFHNDERIVMGVLGKAEERKKTSKIIKAWIKKYGNNPKYALQCAIYNPFFGRTQEEINQQNQQFIFKILEGNQKPFNVNFYPYLTENIIYNEFLNSLDIILGMSSGEAFGLPEFQSVALGKHGVILNAHGYKSWATQENCVLVNPNGKEVAEDNIFFRRGSPFNNGSWFTWDEDEFISSIETCVNKVKANKVNKNGLLLQQEFSKELFLDNILKYTYNICKNEVSA